MSVAGDLLVLLGLFFGLALGRVLRMAIFGYGPSTVQIAGVLSRAAYFRALVFIDVAEQQYVAQRALIVAWKSATRGEYPGVAIGAEQAVPDRQDGEIKAMHVKRADA
jgi:hypothetical protein